MGAVQNLGLIPFGTLIGGPLEAAVKAQAISAMTSIEFIERVGFDAADASGVRPVKNVSFQYTKTDETGTDKNFKLTVPILTIMPVPYLQIESLDIDFTAKLTDMMESSSSSQTSADASLSASAKWGWGRASFRGSFSSSHNSASKSTSNSEYTMNIKVRAVQPALPAGMSRILDILEAVITEKQQTN
jgi:hypothetical protein